MPLPLLNGWSQSRLLFRMPVGVGTSHTVQIVVAMNNASASIGYAPPKINSVSTTRPQTSGGQFQISGTGFGTAPSVKLGAASCTLVSPSDTLLM